MGDITWIYIQNKKQTIKTNVLNFSTVTAFQIILLRQFDTSSMKSCLDYYNYIINYEHNRISKSTFVDLPFENHEYFREVMEKFKLIASIHNVDLQCY